MNTYRPDGAEQIGIMTMPKNCARIIHSITFYYHTKLNAYGFLVVNGGSYRFGVPIDQ